MEFHYSSPSKLMYYICQLFLEPPKRGSIWGEFGQPWIRQEHEKLRGQRCLVLGALISPQFAYMKLSRWSVRCVERDGEGELIT